MQTRLWSHWWYPKSCLLGPWPRFSILGTQSFQKPMLLYLYWAICIFSYFVYTFSYFAQTFYTFRAGTKILWFCTTTIPKTYVFILLLVFLYFYIFLYFLIAVYTLPRLFATFGLWLVNPLFGHCFKLPPPRDCDLQFLCFGHWLTQQSLSKWFEFLTSRNWLLNTEKLPWSSTKTAL